MSDGLSDGLPLSEMVLSAGALGTAAFGIVEGLKGTRLGELGFRWIPATLGSAVMNAVGKAYGPDCLLLLKAQYSSGRGKGELSRTLRQGVRIGLTLENVQSLAEAVGVVEAGRLRLVIGKIQNGGALEPEDKSILGRFELAVDARIDAALGLAERSYVASVRWIACCVAIVLALLAVIAICLSVGKFESRILLWGLIVGVAAVPLAPIAKDISSGIQAAAKALRAKT